VSNSTVSPELQFVDIKKLVASATNPRKHFDKKQLQDLSDSIKKQGVVSPLLVRPIDSEMFEIVAGERRFRAAQMAGLKTVPVIVRAMDDNTALEVQVIENLQRQDLHPLEEAEGYELLIKKHGYQTADDVAGKIGKSCAYVYSRMKLCALIPEAREAFYNEILTPSTALLVARIPEQLQLQALKAITGEKAIPGEVEGTPLSFKAAAEYIHDNFTTQLSNAPFDTKDENLIPDVGSCVNCPKRTGNQQELFSDIKRADICTDTTCFASKKTAQWDRATAKYAAMGCRILPVDNDRLFWNADLNSNRHVLLDGKCEEDTKGRTFKVLIDDKLDYKKVIIARDGRGKARAVLTRGDAIKMLEERGYDALVKKMNGGTDHQGRPVDKTESHEEQEIKREQMKWVAEQLFNEAMAVIVPYVSKSGVESALKLLISYLIQNTRLDDVFDRLEIMKGEKEFLDVLEGVSGEKLAELTTHVVFNELPYNAWQDSFEDQFVSMCKQVGYDLKKRKKELLAAVQSKVESPKTEETTPAPKKKAKKK